MVRIRRLLLSAAVAMSLIAMGVVPASAASARGNGVAAPAAAENQPEGLHILVDEANSHCLAGGLSAPQIILESCNSSDEHQNWWYSGSNPSVLIDWANGYCLSGGLSSTSPEVTLETCNGSDEHQDWTWNANQQLVDEANGHCLAGGLSAPEITLEVCNSSDEHQIWL